MDDGDSDLIHRGDALALPGRAARSVFTGRGAFRSGLDMFVVGVGVALVGYYVGGWVGRQI